MGTDVLFNIVHRAGGETNLDSNVDFLKHLASTFWDAARCRLKSGKVAFQACVPGHDRSTPLAVWIDDRQSRRLQCSNDCFLFDRAIVSTGNVLHALESVIRRFYQKHLRMLEYSLPVSEPRLVMKHHCKRKRKRISKTARRKHPKCAVSAYDNRAYDNRHIQEHYPRRDFCSNELAEKCTASYLEKGIKVGRDVSGFGNYISSWHRVALEINNNNHPSAHWPPILFVDTEMAITKKRAICRFALTRFSGSEEEKKTALERCNDPTDLKSRTFDTTRAIARGKYTDAQRHVLVRAQQQVDKLRVLGNAQLAEFSE